MNTATVEEGPGSTPRPWSVLEPAPRETAAADAIYSTKGGCRRGTSTRRLSCNPSCCPVCEAREDSHGNRNSFSKVHAHNLPFTHSSVVLRHGRTCSKKCVERYCELANKNVKQLQKSVKSQPGDHQSKQEELESVGELSQVCSQMVLKCLYLARIGRPDILWSVNKLARSVTKWTQTCDRRLARLISYIHHTKAKPCLVLREQRSEDIFSRSWGSLVQSGECR